MGDTVLEADDLGKGYKGFELSGLSFKLERGTVMGLIGPNGAGKTTTIRLLMGLARPKTGRALLFGEDPAGPHARSLKERLGFVYDDGRFYGSLSARDNGAWIGKVYRSWDGERYESLLKDFGVDPKKKADDLSRGQKTKMSLAVALSHGAELLVLDEPTSGLDPVSRSEILDLLYAFIADGQRSVLFSTHITADLERIADYVTFLKDGRLVWSEETGSVIERHAVVKGAMRDFEAVKPLLVGARLADAGFEGLCDRASELIGLPSGVYGGLAVDKASLDEIVVYSTREDYRVCVSA